MKKIIPIVLVALVAGGLGAKMFLLPKPPEPKKKVEGVLVPLPEFTVNLSDGGFAKVKVALEVSAEDEAVAAAAAGGEEGGAPPEIHLPQEPIIREVVLDDLNEATAKELTSASGKETLRKEILSGIKKRSDHKVEEVIFSDVVVDAG
jgi:flagellar basal body-associated protein FliL